MCGRFMITKKVDDITVRYRAELDFEKYKPVYNAAPTMQMPVITNQKPQKIEFFRWGLIPFWAKDVSVGNKMINARAESLTEKVSFKNLLARKRCLVIADGFYEWKKTGKMKIPYCIRLKNNELFSFAGLWDTWKNNDGESIYSFTIITTSPNEKMKEIHDRMPVILNPEREDLWMSDSADIDELKSILIPIDSALIETYPVSTLVNSPSNNSPEVLTPYQYD
ncbi:MAG TPA: SOS response-associated peptidase [Bacteroidia bacterium]|nr:SOS response-associated peptidase [Bacteroidia bacterium]HRS57678.1 SOS response-associated peptidase [Bacteroidia bacterium]HRU67107.1 SOS response-associated peptidase [Bacteroidia bacterium]